MQSLLSADAARGLHRRGARRLREDPRAAPRQEGAGAAARRSPRRARSGHADRLVGLPAAAPRKPGLTVLRDYPLDKLRAVHRLDAVLPGLGALRALSEDPRGSGRRRGGAQAATPTRWRCCSGSCAKNGSRERRARPLPGGAGERRRHRDLPRRDARASVAHDLAQPAPAEPEADRPRQPVPGGLRRAEANPACPTGSAPSRWPSAASRRTLAQFEAQHDDYNAIMLKVLADRLAEAFAEHLHERVRREFWGYAPDERADGRATDRRDLPRHPPGARLSRLPGPHREGRAVRAARGRAERRHARSPSPSRCCRRPRCRASTSRIPSRRYFAVGKIGRDQVEDYARRKGMRGRGGGEWLAPYLDYEPADIMAAHST